MEHGTFFICNFLLAAAALFDHGGHILKLLFHVAYQLELGTAAVEIVSFAVNLEVGIAFQIVRQETHTDFQCDKFAGERQFFFFSGGQEFCGRAEITFQQALEEIHPHIDLAQILFVLGGRAGAGADHIAEVVMHQTGHDRIKVDHGDFFTRNIIK